MRELLSAQEQEITPQNFEWNYLSQLCEAKVLLGPQHGGATRAIAFSPDGRRAASCGIDGHVNIFDTATGKKLLDFPGSSETCSAMAFSPDGKLVAYSSNDHLITVCDSATAAKLREIPNARGTINGLAFSPDGKHLAFSASTMRSSFAIQRRAQFSTPSLTSNRPSKPSRSVPIVARSLRAATTQSCGSGIPILTCQCKRSPATAAR